MIRAGTTDTKGKEWHTFVCILVEPTKGVDLIVVAIRHRGIDQACRYMAQRLSDTGTVVRTATATPGWTGRHEEGLLRLL